MLWAPLRRGIVPRHKGDGGGDDRDDDTGGDDDVVKNFPSGVRCDGQVHGLRRGAWRRRVAAAAAESERRW